MALKLRRKRQPGLVAALLAAMLLAACDTQPATNVTSDAATLNSKGSCANGTYGGTNQYQLRKVTDTGGGVGAFYDVGPRFRFDCNGATGEVPLNAHRQGGLADGTVYEFRLVSRMDTGQVHTWDANGNNGGNAFDSFYTPVAVDPSATQSEGAARTDPDTGEVFPIAEASGNCSRRPTEVTRDGVARAKFTGIVLWRTHLMAPFRYCNGQITRMYTADASCSVPSLPATFGWSCTEKSKVRAYSTGGNPEHAVYTYRFKFERWLPVKGVLVKLEEWIWCSTIQISGSGAWFTHGSCDIKPWGS